jgi:hypothetical protein
MLASSHEQRNSCSCCHATLPNYEPILLVAKYDQFGCVQVVANFFQQEALPNYEHMLPVAMFASEI